MSNRRIAILLAVSAMSTASVRAQEPASALPERLTLPILLRLVAERSPRLAIEQTSDLMRVGGWRVCTPICTPNKVLLPKRLRRPGAISWRAPPYRSLHLKILSHSL